jgi:hypothetical protein
LKKLGLTDRKYQGCEAVRIPYRTEAGEEAAVRFRVALEKSDEGDRFKWRTGSLRGAHSQTGASQGGESIASVDTIAHGEMVEKELDAFIERRSRNSRGGPVTERRIPTSKRNSGGSR